MELYRHNTQFYRYRRPPSYDPLELRRFADTKILILTVKSCYWDEIDIFFWISVQITVTNLFPQTPKLLHLEFLDRVNGFWRKINTLSYIILNKIYDFIDFNFGYKLYIHRYSTYDYFDLRLPLGHIFGPKYSRISGDTCTLFFKFTYFFCF